MCKYCKGDFLDNKDILNKTSSLGLVGNMILETKIDKDDKSGRRQLSTKVTILTHGCMSDYMETYKRNINYCPFCGRKLGKDV